MPMRIPARPLSIRCWPKLISQNGTQLPASEMATLNSQKRRVHGKRWRRSATRPVGSTAAMISLIVTSAVGLKPRTAMPVNMKALPHIATRANSSSQWPSGRVIESNSLGVSSRGAARLEHDHADGDNAGREHAPGAERLAQQPVPINAAMITLVSRSAETAAIGVSVIAQITRP